MEDKQPIGFLDPRGDRADFLRGMVQMVRSVGNTVTATEVDAVLAKESDEIRNNTELREELIALGSE